MTEPYLDSSLLEDSDDVGASLTADPYSDSSLLTEEEVEQPGVFSRMGQAFMGGVRKSVGETVDTARDVSDFLFPLRPDSVQKHADIFGDAGEILAERGRKELVKSTGKEGFLGRVGDVAKVPILSGTLGDAAVSTAGLVGEFGSIVIPTRLGYQSVKISTKKIPKVLDRDTADFVGDFFEKSASKNAGQPIPERLNRAGSKFLNQFVNTLRPIEKIGKRAGAEKEFLIQAQWVRGIRQVAKNPVENATRTLEGTVTGESLLDISKDIAITGQKIGVDDMVVEQHLQTLLATKRHFELVKRGIKSTSKINKRAIAQQNTLRKMYGTDSNGKLLVLDDLADRYREWSIRAFIDPLQEVGVLSKKEVKKILDSNEFYAPFERAINKIEESGFDLTKLRFGGRGVPIKGKKIGAGLSDKTGERLNDIFEVSADRAYRIQAFAQKQKLVNMLADASDLTPAIRKEIFPTDLPGHLKNVERVFRNGKRVNYAMEDDLVEALSELNPKELDWINKAAINITDTFRAGTTVSPKFSVKNFWRDLTQSFVYSKHGQLPVVSPVKAIFEEFLVSRPSNFFKTGKYEASQYWKDFMASPGPFSSFVSLDKSSLTGELNSLKKISLLSPGKRVGYELAKDPLHPLKVLSNTLEKPSRFAEFKLARKKGKDIGEAGLDASDITINFLRSGSLGGKWNRYEAFANVLFQDPDKFIRAMKDKPWSTSVKAISAITLPVMGSWAKNRNNPDWQNLDEWEKFAFFHPMQLGEEGKGGKFIRIPLPAGILSSLFGYLPLKAAQWAFDGNDAAAEEFVQTTLRETPLKYIPGASISARAIPGGQPLDSPNIEDFDAIIELMPNAIQPLVELGMNRSPFFDQPAIQQRLLALPPDQRVTEMTTSPAKFLGGIPGLERLTKGPAGVDYLIRAYAGTLGADVAKAVTSGLSREVALRNEPQVVQDFPVLNILTSGFTSQSPVGFGSKPVREFYILREQAKEAAKGIDAYVDLKDKQSKLKNNPEAKYVKALNSVSQQLSGLAKLKRETIKTKGLSASERDHRLMVIDQRITVIAGLTVERVRDLVMLDLQEEQD